MPTRQRRYILCSPQPYTTLRSYRVTEVTPLRGCIFYHTHLPLEERRFSASLHEAQGYTSSFDTRLASCRGAALHYARLRIGLLKIGASSRLNLPYPPPLEERQFRYPCTQCRVLRRPTATRLASCRGVAIHYAALRIGLLKVDASSRLQANTHINLVTFTFFQCLPKPNSIA